MRMENFIADIKTIIEDDFFDGEQRGRILRTLREMDRIISGEVVCIYVQNMFLDREAVNFYVFSEKNLIIASTSVYNTKIEVLKLKGLKSFEYVIDNDTNNIILRLHFDTNRNITFNNNLDTDKKHSIKLKKDIINIVNHLLEVSEN